MFWKSIILYFQSKWHLKFVKQKKKKHPESWHTKRGNLTTTKTNKQKKKNTGSLSSKIYFNLWGLVSLYLQLCSLTPQITKPLLCSYPPHLCMALPFNILSMSSTPPQPPKPVAIWKPLHPLPHLWMLPLASCSSLTWTPTPEGHCYPVILFPTPASGTLALLSLKLYSSSLIDATRPFPTSCLDSSSFNLIPSDYVTHYTQPHALEKEMAAHSGVLAWRIPGTGGPGGLPSMGSHRVGHN